MTGRYSSVSEAQDAARERRDGYRADTPMQRQSLTRRAKRGDERAQRALDKHNAEHEGDDK